MEWKNSTILILLFIVGLVGVFLGAFVVNQIGMGHYYAGSSGARFNPTIMGGVIDETVAMEKGSVGVEPGDVGVGEINTPPDYMIAKEYHITIEHKEVNKLVNDIIAQANLLGGKLVSSSFNAGQYSDNGYVVVKVPVDKEEQFTSYLKQYKIIQSNVNVIEVSKQYMDIEDRIELLQAKLQLYQDYVDNNKLSPEVAERYYDKIFSLKAQIEYLEKQKEELNERTAYSTFYISITNEKEYKVGKITINFSQVWFNIKKTWAEILVLLVYFVTIVLPLGLVGFVVYKKVRRG